MRILIVNYEFPPIGAGGGQASQKVAECPTAYELLLHVPRSFTL
jgi:hypothetical protein